MQAEAEAEAKAILGTAEAIAEAAEVEAAADESALLRPHRKALEYLKNVPWLSRTTLNREDNKVVLQAGLTRLSLDSIDPEGTHPSRRETWQAQRR